MNGRGDRVHDAAGERPGDRSGSDWLDAALAARGIEAHDSYIDDAGFTARVMANLPAPFTPVRWRRPILMLLWGLAAAGLAMTLPSTLVDLTRDAVRLFAGRPFALSDAATLVALAGAAMWTATWLAWRRA